MSNIASVETKTEDKHIVLHREIENIDRVIRRLSDLQERITGPRPEVDGAGKALCDPPSLQDMLNDGPSHIAEKLQQIHQQIDTLTEILF